MNKDKNNKSKSKDATTDGISIITDEQELEGEMQSQKERIEKALPTVPSLIKADISLDTIYSDLQNTELQLHLQKIYSKVNSPMRRVADFLELHHIDLKGKEICYWQLAKVLHLTEQQVYDAVKDLNVFEGYGFKFIPARKPHRTTDDYGSFLYSIDDFTRWAKENDIREKTVTRKITVIQQSHEHMLPVYKDKMKKHKIQRIKETKKKIIDLQTVSVPVAPASGNDTDKNEDEEK